MAGKVIQLRECDPCGGDLDDGEPVVKGVRVQGLVSRNNRRYLSEALKKAIPLYEGAWSYLNHPAKGQEDQPRRTQDKFGRFHNVRMGEDGLRGDYHFNPHHPFAPTFTYWLKTDPEAVGFSPNQTGKVREDGEGGMLVEEIVEVDSIDLVSRPATTKGLYEWEGDGMEAEDDLTADVTPDLTPEPAAADAGAGDHEEAILVAAKACIDDPNLPIAEKIAKIRKLLGMTSDGGLEEAPEAGMEDEEKEPGGVVVEKTKEGGIEDEEEEPGGVVVQKKKAEEALAKGSSQEAISKNIAQLRREGYEADQAAAIAYRVAGKSRNPEAEIRQLRREVKAMSAKLVTLTASLTEAAPALKAAALAQKPASRAPRPAYKTLSTEQFLAAIERGR